MKIEIKKEDLEVAENVVDVIVSQYVSQMDKEMWNLEQAIFKAKAFIESETHYSRETGHVELHLRDESYHRLMEILDGEDEPIEFDVNRLIIEKNILQNSVDKAVDYLNNNITSCENKGYGHLIQDELLEILKGEGKE